METGELLGEVPTCSVDEGTFSVSSLCSTRGRPIKGSKRIRWSSRVFLALITRMSWVRPPHGPRNVTGEEKAHDPTGTRTQDPSHAVRALWPLIYRATQSTCDTSIIQAIENLYDNTQSAVLFGGSTGEWLRTTVESDKGVFSHQPSLTSS